MANSTKQSTANGATQNDTKTNGTSTPNVESQVNAPSAEEKKIMFDGKEYTQAELDALIKSLDEQKKALKAAAKGEKPKATKEGKGIMVAFKNKAGETIVGLGVIYYVARHGGKLHYKEASQVSILPKDWKEGDPIPAPPAQVAASEETKK